MFIRKEYFLLLILQLFIIGLISCEKETIFPDYSKYRIKNIYSKLQYYESGYKFRYHYIYTSGSKIDSINKRDDIGDLSSCRKFYYSDNRLSVIDYPNIKYGGSYGKDSIIYDKSDNIDEVLLIDEDNKVFSVVSFEYNDYGKIIKKMTRNYSEDFYSELEEYTYDTKGNIIEEVRYDSDITNTLVHSYTRLYSYDEWVNPYYSGGYIGRNFKWPLSLNNVVERTDVVPESDDQTWTFYYEYLEDGYPLKTNSTLRPLDMYTEFEYEKK